MECLGGGSFATSNGISAHVARGQEKGRRQGGLCDRPLQGRSSPGSREAAKDRNQGSLPLMLVKRLTFLSLWKLFKKGFARSALLRRKAV